MKKLPFCLSLIILCGFMLCLFLEAAAEDADFVLYPIRENGLWGYMNRQGETVIEPKWTYVWPFDGETALISTCPPAALSDTLPSGDGIIDRNGSYVLTPAENTHDGLGDFQHIGLVTSVNPLRIVHASSAVGCVTTDEKLGKWAYWGRLKDVAKTDSLPPTLAEPTEEDEEPMAEFATVIADSGSTVNMRSKAKSTAALVERVPLGARVEILGTCGSWTKVKFGSRSGYMMSQFLTAEEPLEPDEDLTLEERVTRLEKRVAMLEMKDGAVG